MSPGLRTSAKQFCRVGVTLLLVVQALSSLLNNPLMNSYAEAIIDYASFRSAAEVRAAAEKNIARGNSSLAVANQSSMAAINVLAGESALVGSTLDAGAATEKKRIDVPPSPPSPPSISPSPIGSPLAALGDEALDEVRGGFEPADSNLRFSFGIERAVYINGELVAHTVLNLKDMQWVTGTGGVPQGPSNVNANAALGVVQNGLKNSFTAQIGSNLAGTVVQNTLDNQRIQNVTTINAAVNSAQLLRSMSVQAAVHNGIVGSLRN